MRPNEMGPSLKGSFETYLSALQLVLESKKIDVPYWPLKGLGLASPDYQVGALFEALDEGVLVAGSKSFEHFFAISKPIDIIFSRCSAK